MEQLNSICVYCGASNRVNNGYLTAAERLGTRLAEQRKRLVYGGGEHGLMGRIADAALTGGGEVVVGIMPRALAEREKLHRAITELQVVEDMHTRKGMMMERADAFVVLPGGLGTLEEFFEILTWKQLGIHDKPIAIVNIDGYWNRLFDMVDHIVETGFARDTDRDLYMVLESVDEILDALKRAPEPSTRVQTEIV